MIVVSMTKSVHIKSVNLISNPRLLELLSLEEEAG